MSDAEYHSDFNGKHGYANGLTIEVHGKKCSGCRNLFWDLEFAVLQVSTDQDLHYIPSWGWASDAKMLSTDTGFPPNVKSPDFHRVKSHFYNKHWAEKIIIILLHVAHV